MVESTPTTHYFDNNDAYRQETSRFPHDTSSQAIGVSHPDKSIDVYINRSYYLGKGGILPEQLQAIIVHEVTESACRDKHSPDPHYEATVAEYQWIYNRVDGGGAQELFAYHCKMESLIGAIGSKTRRKALTAVLGYDPYAEKR